MHRCLIGSGDWERGNITLGSTEAHHLVHVLRARKGDSILAFDGKGREARAVVEDEREALIRVVESPLFYPKAACEIVLIQALPKGQKMDFIMEKAAEMGASAVWPVITERVVVRLDDSARADRIERWGRILLSAARQCGACWLPEVRPITDYARALGEFRADELLLVGALQADSEPIREVLTKIRDTRPRRVGLVIGPEGDLTAEEMRQAVDHHAVPVNFGTRVLRAETAALFGISVLAYEFL